MKAPLTIRQMIALYIETVRECRKDREYPTLFGAAYVVATQGTSCYQRVEGGYNMAGSWNRGACYTYQHTAMNLLCDITEKRPQLGPLRVVHRNTLRDDTERTALEMLRHLLPHRNKKLD